jgi:ATP/maltotriose-dependent transcriptional regulator MalT
MTPRVTSTRFVGRTAELAECESALADAATGRPSLLAICGESGVGKTRLLSAFEDASGQQARFLKGACVELGDGELPYAPLSAALRELVRCEDPVFERLSPSGRSALAALVPSLRDEPGNQPNDESAQLRLFEALLELLRLIGESTPVALVLEDMHWADRSTRAFTAFLARSMLDERVLFVFTYRSDEMHRLHPLLPLLSELERGSHARRIAVEPWGEAELGEALSDILGAAASPELLARLFKRAEGNALYTEELLAAGLDGRGVTPQSLQDAFMLRFERLGAQAHPVMRALAVARQADESVLSQVAGRTREVITAALRQAVADHVVTASSDGRFEFRHELLREAVYEDLLPGERAELHQLLATVLESHRSNGADRDAGLAAAVAAHARAAGDFELTLAASLSAAEAASLIHAHGDAAELLEGAMEAWPHVPPAARAIDHPTLLLRAADEHALDQQRTRAQTLLVHALAELDPASEPECVASALERLARTQWNLSRGDDALASARDALALLSPGRDDALRATLLAWLARTTFLRGRYRDAVDAAQEAIEMIGASCAGTVVESQARNTLAMALVGSGAVDEGLAEMRSALALAERSDDAFGMESAYANLADLLLQNGRAREALVTAKEGLARGQATGTPSTVWLATTVAETAFAAGDWQLAADSLANERKVMEGRSLINLRLRQAELQLGRGELAPAERNLREIETLVADSLEPQWHANYGLALGELHERRGELDAARAALEEALDRIQFCTDDARGMTAIAAALVAVDAKAAQIASDVGDDETADLAAQRAGQMMELVHAGAESAGVVGIAWSRTAEAWVTRVRSGDDPALWARAAASWNSVERPYPAAKARLHEVEGRLERGERQEAAECLGETRAAAQELGADWLVTELDEIALRARITLGVREESGEAAASTAENPFELTAREQEVLALLTRGATNREIGAELYMAEKTASVHVSRILSKLGVRSRTQAAAVAHRTGLVGANGSAALGLPGSDPVE